VQRAMVRVAHTAMLLLVYTDATAGVTLYGCYCWYIRMLLLVYTDHATAGIYGCYCWYIRMLLRVYYGS
jgi:hypothetical protein